MQRSIVLGRTDLVKLALLWVSDYMRIHGLDVCKFSSFVLLFEALVIYVFKRYVFDDMYG